MKKYILLLLIVINFSGCWFSLGNTTGMCEGEGCNYKEAGVCAGVVDIYKNRHNIENYKVQQRWYWFDKEVE